MCTSDVKLPEDGIGSLVCLKFWESDSLNKNFSLSTIVYEPHRPSERPWETIFSGSSHDLPPLTKLCSPFLESLLERRTTTSTTAILKIKANPFCYWILHDDVFVPMFVSHKSNIILCFNFLFCYKTKNYYSRDNTLRYCNLHYYSVMKIFVFFFLLIYMDENGMFLLSCFELMVGHKNPSILHHNGNSLAVAFSVSALAHQCLASLQRSYFDRLAHQGLALVLLRQPHSLFVLLLLSRPPSDILVHYLVPLISVFLRFALYTRFRFYSSIPLISFYKSCITSNCIAAKDKLKLITCLNIMQKQ
ncbi:hypothetical protein G4B88_016489 [Cannabis sativa]|uniref:Uncharacterized protein n=1 Tax=Cannabis sativa TaxID=3483 RepID=A0A7J6H9N7_CANSA|nr:hypothetical protein G4B88_016489 [Cannabis sativa]